MNRDCEGDPCPISRGEWTQFTSKIEQQIAEIKLYLRNDFKDINQDIKCLDTRLDRLDTDMTLVLDKIKTQSGIVSAIVSGLIGLFFAYFKH